METMSNTSALIVGGGSGIGFATAEAMLQGGARVWIAGRTESKLEAAVAFEIGPPSMRASLPIFTYQRGTPVSAHMARRSSFAAS